MKFRTAEQSLCISLKKSIKFVKMNYKLDKNGKIGYNMFSEENKKICIGCGDAKIARIRSIK